MTGANERPARAVLIVGASSGMGLAAARRFAARGDRLVLVSRSESALLAAAWDCRRAGAGEVDTVVADVAVQAEVEAAVAATTSRHGRIDVVVHTAAVMAYGTIETVPAPVFEQVVATAVLGTANVARAVLPQFRRQSAGTLIVVNSLLGSVTVPDLGAYAVAKWGQRALVRTLQQELRRVRGVRVCLVSPGSVNTPIYYQAANFLGREVRPPWPVRSPEHLGKIIERLADRPRQHVSLSAGAANPLIISGFRLAPALYDRIVAALFRTMSLSRRRLDPSTGNVDRPQPDAERMHGHWPDPHD
jgi:NAD(P)-dependent dehydrogenase (short-subunit alcohol dehydrogenase family)